MRILSQIISVIFHPILIPTLFCVILFNSESYLSMLSMHAKLLTGIAIFATTFVLPTSFMPILKHYKVISSYEMDNGKERLMPMFITCISYGICFFELVRFPFPVPGIFYRSLIGASVALLCCLLISAKWKISAHTTGLGGLLASVLCFGLRYGALVDHWLALVFIATGLTFSARLYLQAHTVHQVVAGFVLGFGCVSLFILFV